MGTDRTTLRWRTRVAVIVAGATLGMLAAAAPTSAQAEPPAPSPKRGGFTAADLKPVGSEEAPKALTSQIAESDPDLVASTSSKPTPVMIKLDYDPLATYDGSLRNLPATSPSVTDVPLTEATVTSSPYARHVARTEAGIVADMESAVPAVDVGTSFRVVYGGVSATVPANQIKKLLKVDGVVAVQADELNQLQTEETPQQIGAGPVWSGLGGQATAGNGTLFASLDSGVWPEHPSFADVGTTPAKPTRPDGTAIACEFGDNPLTPANDPFPCNDKLVGGEAFIDTYNSLVGGEIYPTSARDSNGHGTHTASTAAGNIVDASLLGTDRGEISGVAPGAWVVSYKVCGATGCYGSDTAAAVQQAVVDGVDVINYSISGGSAPGTDATELAFLDAYAAGVFVSASAGNSGPTTNTVDHLGPWVTTVAATTPSRSFQATVDYTADGVPGSVTGTSLGAGTGATPLPVVLASAPPYSNALCNTTPPAPDTFAGKIVVCDLSSGRVAKSFNVQQGGGKGMILVSTAPSATTTDNYWIPTVHIDQASGVALKTALGTGATTAVLSPGVATTVPGDEIAPFSSRGPRGDVIKPDLAAPGVQVLAGTTPTPESVSGGPEGELYMAIPGTSMAAPHVAGAALLLRDRNPSWSPGQIRSALMTTAKSGLTKGEDGQPAKPLDEGSGRVRLDRAADPGLVLDETATRFGTLGLDPLSVVHLNIASVSAPKMPGKVVTTRTFTNTGGAANYTATTTAGPGSSITVEPASFSIPAGGQQTVTITISSTNDGGGQEFGSITLTAGGRPDLRLPVSFDPEPGDVTIEPTGCTPATIDALASSSCGYAIQNGSFHDTTVDLRAQGDATAEVTGADQGATTAGGVATASAVPLEGRKLGVPTTAAGSSPAGYLPLDLFGTTPAPIGDEQFLSYNVPAFSFNGVTYTSLAVSSNGFLLAGSSTAADQNCCNLTQIGDPARPNNVIAPYWTDLDGGGAPGIYVNVLTDGVSDWTVVEWRVNVFGTNSRKVFQVWIGANGTQDISFTYDPANLPGSPSGQPFLIGAENEAGAGVGLTAVAPTGDLRVTSTAPGPGATLNWKVDAKGLDGGTAAITAEASSPILPGSDLAENPLTVNALPLPTITDDPEDESVTALETASFSATATGGTLVRWEVSTDDGGSWGTVPGATSSPLTFTAHGDQDGNRYRAVFANGTGHETASDDATLTVGKISTDTDVTVSPASPVRNQAVTFTADTGTTTATGTVQFEVDGTNHGAPVALTAGQATSSSISTLSAGNHTVTATYAGDTDHTGSDDDTAFEVLKIGSDTSIVTITPHVSVVGDDVTVDVKVQPAPSGGNVQLKLNGSAHGAPISVDSSTGKGTFTVTGLAPGDYTAVAVFSGDDDLAPSTSASASFSVDKKTSAIGVTVDPSSPTRGDDVTFHAELFTAGATGTVQFKVDGTAFGAPVPLVNGTADSASTVEIPAGDHTVAAEYSGDANHEQSFDVEAFTMAKIETTTSITGVDPAAIVTGDDIEVDVAVAPAPTGGTVQLQVDGADAGPATSLSPAGTATITLSGTAVGDHELTAVFSGTADHLGSASDVEDITVIGGDEAFVRLGYRIVLGRNGDAAGVAFWTDRLGRGYDRASFIKELSTGAEGRRHTVRVAFLEVLGRNADPSGLAFWSNRLANGTTVEQMVADLLASNESYARSGGTAAGYAQRLYTVLLGRTGNAGGAAYWTNRIAADNTTAGRRAAAVAFGKGTEVTNVAVTKAGILACGADHPILPGDRATMGQLWAERGHHAQRLAGTALRISCPPDES